MSRYRLTFITPLFSKGSYDAVPEVRPPSIRGQLHGWFRALGGSAADEKAIFGGVQNGAVASKVVVRVSHVIGDTGMIHTLPHKQGGQASPKAAYRSGTHFDLHLISRLGGLDERLQKAFQRTVEAWLLMGTLGLRGTRAGGSFHWESLDEEDLTAPESFAAYEARCRKLLEGASLRFSLLKEPFSSAEEARKIISDTLGGRDEHQGEDDLATLNHPLGKIRGERKTSPLRFRLVQLGADFHIAALWDDRSAVTGNRPGDLEAVIELLAKRGKKIGVLMKREKFL